MGRIIDNLRGEIEKLRHVSTDEKHFVCQHDIRALFTKTVIAEAIRECVEEYAVPDYHENIVANRIFTEGKIVFGILIWKKWVHKLMSVIEHNALDSQLPLKIPRAEKIMENVGWDFAQNAQWEFLPRTLTKEMSGYHDKFRNEEILPFIDETRLGEGSFGEVFRMSVLPSLQTIFPEQTAEVFVVRKTFRKDLSLEREKECLQILDHLQHPNIVKLLASFSHCGEHHFLFPLLQIDLDIFLQLRERFGEYKKDFTFYIALEGLSSALEKVHSLNLSGRNHDAELGRIGYHHDLRPGNVLVDSRTFYLADFGLARLRPEDMGSRTRWKVGLGDYVPPECSGEQLICDDIGRTMDIWSFGCMISEIAAYIECGPDGVSGFRKQRFGAATRPNMNDRYFFSGKDLRPQVISWFEKFKTRSEGSVLHNLLKIAGLMLKIDPIERPKAAKVHQQLLYLSVKSLYDAVQQALTRYLQASDDQGDFGPAVPMIRFQNARFAAWGKVVQLIESRPSADAIEAISNQGEYIRHILTNVLEIVGEMMVDEATPTSAIAVSIRKPFHEELKELVEKLWKSHPAGHQENIEDYCEDSALHDILSNNRKGRCNGKDVVVECDSPKAKWNEISRSQRAEDHRAHPRSEVRSSLKFVPKMASVGNGNDSIKLCYKPELGHEIGSGGFGVVFLAQIQRSGMPRPELCAAKRISKANHTFPRQKYEREIANFARLLEYEWFLQFFGWYEDEYWIYITMEYMEFGDLQSYIDFQWTEEDTKVVARQLLEGLKAMHDDGILHRDLKPANIFPILLDNRSLRIKIGDFGVSKRISNESSTIAITVAGSMDYMAPEVQSPELTGYTNAVDLWSLGCILFRMISGNKVFFNVTDMYGYYYGKVNFPRHRLHTAGLSEAGIDLIECLIHRNPTERGMAKLIIENNWVTSVPPGFHITETLVQHIQDRRAEQQGSWQHSI